MSGEAIKPGTPLPWEHRIRVRQNITFGKPTASFLAPAGAEDPFEADAIARFYTRDGLTEREDNAAYAAFACNEYPALKAKADALAEAVELAEACGEPSRVALYDEEGVEGWRWSHPDGREWDEVGDWQEMPLHPILAQALAAYRESGQ